MWWTCRLCVCRTRELVESQSWPHSPLPGSQLPCRLRTLCPSSSFSPSRSPPSLLPRWPLPPRQSLRRNHIYPDWIPPRYDTCRWTAVGIINCLKSDNGLPGVVWQLRVKYTSSDRKLLQEKLQPAKDALGIELILCHTFTTSCTTGMHQKCDREWGPLSNNIPVTALDLVHK